MQYVLCRIEDDSSTSFVSEHADIVEGIQAGKHMVDAVDWDYAYSLHTADDWCRVATFADGRIGYRMWAMRTGRLSPSVEDRYDHDVDELLTTS